MSSPETLAGIDYNRIRDNASLDPSERARSRLFWRDDMENYKMNKWSPMVPGSIAEYVNNPPYGAFEGNYVLSIRNSDPSFWSAMVKVLFGALTLGKHSVELRWFKASNIQTLVLCIHHSSPVKGEVLTAALSYSAIDQVWRYGSVETGGPINISGTEETIENDTWNYLKLIIDLKKRVYSRLKTGFLDVDLTNLLLYAVRPSATVYPWIVNGGCSLVLGFGYTSANQRGYVDDVRIYLDEV